MKNLLLLLILFSTLYTQAQWKQQSKFEGNPRFAAIDFVVNNEAYFLGGIIASGPNTYIGYNELWKYDAPNDTWTEVSTYPAGTIYAGISFVIDDVAYIGLGADQNGNQSNQLWAFNSISGEWTQKANFPGSPRNYAFAFTAKNKGFVGTGVNFVGGNPIYLGDFWEYDPSADTWTEKSNYPGDGRVGLSGFTINNRGYAGFGDDDFSYYNDFFEYDVDLNAWVPMASFPGENRSFYQTTTANGKGYLLGGEKDHSVYSNEMWSYDPVNGEWNTAFDFTGTSRAYANLFFLNGAFYYGLGLIGPGDDQGANDIWKYELTTGITSAPVSTQPTVYPNPTDGKFTLDLGTSRNHVEVTLSNVQGQQLETWTFDQTEKMVLNFQAPAGCYFLTISTNDSRKTMRVLKK